MEDALTSLLLESVKRSPLTLNYSVAGYCDRPIMPHCLRCIDGNSYSKRALPNSDVNKDLTFKAKDKDKDQTLKAKDQDKVWYGIVGFNRTRTRPSRPRTRTRTRSIMGASSPRVYFCPSEMPAFARQ